MISMDKEYRVEPGGEEATILSTQSARPGYQVVAEWICCGDHQIGWFTNSGESVYRTRRLVEISPYDHIKEGDWCVFWDSNGTFKYPQLGLFQGIDPTGYPQSLGWPDDEGPLTPWGHCMTLAEFLEKYGK